MGNPYTSINDLLYRLGVTANYTGFFYTACAVRLCIEQLKRLLLVMKMGLSRCGKAIWNQLESSRTEHPYSRKHHLEGKSLPFGTVSWEGTAA